MERDVSTRDALRVDSWPMNIEKIKVTTETGQTLEVVVLNKRAEHIEVVLGQGEHSVKCSLSPTRNGLAYAGSVMGRGFIYPRSRQQAQPAIHPLNPNLPHPHR